MIENDKRAMKESTLDKMKAMMAQTTDSQKLQQNEDLAKLRANTSLEKTVLSAQLKNRFPNR
jgi:hypothetical protein